MQFYDLLMLAVLGGAILFGFWKGFAWQVASLAAIFVSYFVARNFNEPVANMIGGDPAWNRFLAMFILFMGTSLVIWLGFGFIKNTIERMHLKTFDRQVGAILGAGKGVILTVLITLFSVSLLGEKACRTICTSRSGNYIARVIGELGDIVPEEIAVPLKPYVKRFQTEMDEHSNNPPAANPNESPTLPNQPPTGGFRPSWGQQNPNMTQGIPGNGASGGFERIGNLQPSQPNQAGVQSQQPVFNGTVGRWQVPAQPASSSSGGFQIPNLPEGLGDAVLDATKKRVSETIDENWRRLMEGKR